MTDKIKVQVVHQAFQTQDDHFRFCDTDPDSIPEGTEIMIETQHGIFVAIKELVMTMAPCGWECCGAESIEDGFIEREVV